MRSTGVLLLSILAEYARKRNVTLDFLKLVSIYSFIGCLGASATLLSAIGADAEGERLRRLLEQRGVETTHLLTRAHRMTLAKHRVIAESQLLVRMELYHQQGRRVVFTNGCFDILHRGHIDYLNQAKALGDVLIVGVNSDGSVRRLKGPTRPINTLEDRAQVLAALSCVDHLIAFEQDTPIQLIRALRPDVFVKGGDYTRANLPEAPLVEQLGGAVGA